MSAFATMMAAVVADMNIGSAAEFRRPPGAWGNVRVVLSKPSDDFGNAIAGTLRADMLAAATALTPQRGDEVRISAITYIVSDTQLDVLALSWRLTLADQN